MIRLVIDTNCIIAGLIRNGLSRQLLFSKIFQFFTPDYALFEINKHSGELCKKAHITFDEFELLIKLLFEKIKIVPKEDYFRYLNEAQHMTSDKDDATFIALALKLSVDGIWSEDYHFQEQHKIKIYTTQDMIQLLN